MSKKIIATNDPELLVYFDSVVGYKGLEEQEADRYFPIPQIPKSFIEYFITEWNKGNIITKVEIEYEEGWLKDWETENKKRQGTWYDERILKPKLNPDNTININIKTIKNCWNLEELKLVLLSYNLDCITAGEHLDSAMWVQNNLLIKK